MMTSIVQHAMDNVWAEPIQDDRYLLQPARLTPDGGVVKSISYAYKQIATPASTSGKTEYWHVYQLGQIPPNVLGVPEITNTWVSIDKIATDTECYIHVYLDNGFSIARSHCYLMHVGQNRNLLLAIKVNNNYYLGDVNIFDPVINSIQQSRVTLNHMAVNISFYTNARHHTSEMRDLSISPDNQMFFETGPLTPDFRAKITADRGGLIKQGFIQANGYIHDYEGFMGDVSLYAGTEVSVFKDETIIGIEYHRLQDLRTFVSKRNNGVSKYLLHLKQDNQLLVHNTDVEYFLVKRTGLGYRGVVIPRVRKDTVTTVTNITHALRTDVITDLMNTNGWTTNSDELFIMCVVRQGGMVRKLVSERNRLKELFVLPRDIIESTMTDINSNIEFWKADNLEISGYAKLIDAKNITREMVYEAYGYYGFQHNILPNPYRISPDLKEIHDRVIQLSNAGILDASLQNYHFAYNQDGYLIGYGQNITPTGAHMVESLLVDRMNTSSGSEKDGTRLFHLSSISTGEFDVKEVDLTTSEMNTLIYTMVNGNRNYTNVGGLDGYSSVQRMVQDGLAILGLKWNKTHLDGLGVQPLSFSANGYVQGDYHYDRTKNPRYIPMIENYGFDTNGQHYFGHIRLYCDGKLLIEDLDYFVAKEGIFITRRQERDLSKYVLFMNGFAHPETSLNYKPDEVGFVKNGKLSNDGFYQLHTGRNLLVNIGGSVKMVDDVFIDGVSKGMLHELDGQPYAITHLRESIIGLTGVSSINELRVETEKDKLVEGYIRQYIAGETANNNVIINTRWQTTSLFASYILSRKRSFPNEITDTSLDNFYRGMTIPFDKYDVERLQRFDRQYVQVTPHSYPEPITLTSQQYGFFQAMLERYLPDFVEYKHLIRIGDE